MTRFDEFAPYEPQLALAPPPDRTQADRFRELAKAARPGEVMAQPAAAPATKIVRISAEELALVRARAADPGCPLCRRILEAADGQVLRPFHDGDGSVAMPVDAMQYHVSQESKPAIDFTNGGKA